MLLVLLATLSMADIPPRGPAGPPCTEERCPEGTLEREWCTTSLGKLPDCAHTRDWTRACQKKAGLRALHLMCRTPTEAAPVPSEPASPAVAPSASGWCQTGPVGAGLWLGLPLLAVLRRRAV